MKPFRVVCLVSPGSTVTDVTIEREILETVGADVELKTAATEAATLAAVHYADGILHRGGCLTASVIAQLDRCRIIAHGGAGYDAVDVSTATANGILVTNVADYCVDEVADHALTLLLAFSKRLVTQVNRVRTYVWTPQGAGTVQRLRDQTVAVVGYGRIGSAFGRKARQLGLRVLAVDPFVPPAHLDRLGAEPCALDEALSQSDFVSLHVPLSPSTRHLIGADQLRRMKRSAYLINTARGGVVDERALIGALTSGQPSTCWSRSLLGLPIRCYDSTTCSLRRTRLTTPRQRFETCGGPWRSRSLMPYAGGCHNLCLTLRHRSSALPLALTYASNLRGNTDRGCIS